MTSGLAKSAVSRSWLTILARSVNPPPAYAVAAELDEIRIDFEAGRVGAEVAGDGENDASVSEAQIEMDFPGLEIDGLQHSLDEGFRRRVVGR